MPANSQSDNTKFTQAAFLALLPDSLHSASIRQWRSLRAGYIARRFVSCAEEILLALISIFLVLLARQRLPCWSDSRSVTEAIAKRVQAAAISTEEKAQLLGLLIIKPELWDA